MEDCEFKTPRMSVEPVGRSKKTAVLNANDSISVTLTGKFGYMSRICVLLPDTVYGDVQLVDNDDGTGSLVLQADNISRFNHCYRSWLSLLWGASLHEMDLESCHILCETNFNGSLEWLVTMISTHNIKHGTNGIETQGKDIELFFGMIEKKDCPPAPSSSPADDLHLAEYAALFIENEADFLNNDCLNNTPPRECRIDAARVRQSGTELSGVLGVFDEFESGYFYSPQDSHADSYSFYDRILFNGK